MSSAGAAPRVRGYLVQVLMLLAMNVPTVSFGLAVGWVSLASGEGAQREEGEAGEAGAALVSAAAATFAAGAAGVPLAARALRLGRRPALAATSAAFAVCWSLKLCGGWWVVAGRVAAGAAGVAAWVVVPLLAKEMCAGGVRGAGAAAPVLAHNLGVLLMYLAADAGLHHRTVLLSCLALSAAHAGLFLLAPESPAFLAAHGNEKEARRALAWLRGVPADHPRLAAELRGLPPPDALHAPWTRLKEMLSSRRRRRAFVVALVALVGQESCGMLALTQFAEHVFAAARGTGAGGASPARLALLLGVVQLVAAAAALYLVERVGRRPLLVWGGAACGAALALGACAARAGHGGALAAALVAAVAADSLGLQPAPYALLADMFHYQYSECAVLAAMAAASAGGAAETLVFAGAAAAGLPAALALAAAATLALAAFALVCVPETRGRTPDQIYDLISPPAPAVCSHRDGTRDKTQHNHIFVISDAHINKNSAYKRFTGPGGDGENGASDLMSQPKFTDQNHFNKNNERKHNGVELLESENLDIFKHNDGTRAGAAEVGQIINGSPNSEDSIFFHQYIDSKAVTVNIIERRQTLQPNEQCNQQTQWTHL